MPAVSLITSLPKFISVEEYRVVSASTPSSFSEIPPVLRHQEDNVAVSFDPTLEGLSIDDCAKGTLYVVERYVQYFLQ
jgi:chloride channel, nucleotide-sensitive, 1A